MAEAYLDNGDSSRATEYLRQAAEIYPASPWVAELRSRARSS
ncbi:MAG: tetratricopeptide repeat protein [Alkalispirochaeta sp.]